MNALPPNGPARLLALTLALESAILSEDWDETNALLNERDLLLGALAQGSLSEALVHSIQEAENRIMTAMSSKRADLLLQLNRGAYAKKLTGTYAPKGSQGAAVDASG